MKRLPKPLLISLIISVPVVVGAAVVPWIVFFQLRKQLYVGLGNNQPMVDFVAFLNTAMWVQAFIAWATFCVIAFGAFNLFFLYRQITIQLEQTRLQMEYMERDAYRPLISPEMVSARRLLYSREVQKDLAKLGTWLDSAEKEESERHQEMLEATRKSFEEIAKTMSWPLLVGTYASLDHVEMLINQYNYLAKLIAEGILRKEFATDLGVDNFKRVNEKASQLIRLRERLSKHYASHFTTYCGKLD